jgi:hypothetical protein
MLAYALFCAFVAAFVALAVAGHVLLLTAIYPNLFSKLAVTADPAIESAGGELGRTGRPPQAPKLVA